MKNKIIALATLGLFVFPLSTFATEPTKTEEFTKAYFVNIADGDVLENPVKIEFGIEGLKIAPAGTNEPETGHFHLLIDTELTEAQKALPIPNDKNHIHYGKGQTEDTITLSPGSHTLQIIMGDGMHKLHKPEIASNIITVTVK